MWSVSILAKQILMDENLSQEQLSFMSIQITERLPLPHQYCQAISEGRIRGKCPQKASFFLKAKWINSNRMNILIPFLSPLLSTDVP